MSQPTRYTRPQGDLITYLSTGFATGNSNQLSTADQRPETVCYMCFSHLQRSRRLADMSHRAEEILSQLYIIQATHENVTELNLRMKQSLAVAPMKYLVISDTHESSPEPDEKVISMKKEDTEGKNTNESSHKTDREDVISMKKKETDGEELLMETVYSHNSPHVTFKVEPIKEEGIADEEVWVDTVTDNYMSEESFKINECLKFEEDNDYEVVNGHPSMIDDEEPKFKLTFCCDICSQTYSVKSELVSHMLQSHARQMPYSCSTCKKQFPGKCILERHMRVHSNEKPYACHICGKKYKYKGDIPRHIIGSHGGEKSYGCDVCGKKYHYKTVLTKHKMTHTGEKPYACDTCGKTFISRASLTSHIRTHTGEKPYACDICDKRYSHKLNLKFHIRNHTGEKPFTCDICVNKYSKNSYLQRHMLVHTGEKPYGCDMCGKKFFQHHHLSRHIRAHTGEKLHACPVCGRRFIEKHHLARHMKIHGKKIT